MKVVFLDWVWFRDRRIFKEPTVILRDKILTVNNYDKDLRNCAKILLKDSGAKLSKLTATLDSLSPLKTLSRGFLVLEDENKNVITSAQDLNTGEVVKLIMHDGEKNAQIL